MAYTHQTKRPQIKGHMASRDGRVLARALVLAAVCLASGVHADNPSKREQILGNDEQSFVFAGNCRNGEKFRLFAYQKSVDGVAASFYDYEGPAGSGTVQTDVTPKVMAARVCIKEVEISSLYR